MRRGDVRRGLVGGIGLVVLGVFLALFPFEIRISPDVVMITGPILRPAIVPLCVGIALLLMFSSDRNSKESEPRDG